MKRYQSHKIVEAAPIIVVANAHSPGGEHYVVVDLGNNLHTTRLFDVPMQFFARGEALAIIAYPEPAEHGGERPTYLSMTDRSTPTWVVTPAGVLACDRATELLKEAG